LGLPLHIGRSRRVDEQALIDKIGARLPGWKGRLLTRAGRLTLINSVLTSIPVYHMTVFPLSKWAIKRIDRIRRNFLWKGASDTRHGSCLVNWRRVNRAKKLGGLGIKDLACFNRALRLRWPWYQWTEPTKPWTGMPLKLSLEEQELFRLCTKITVGNGAKTQLWKDRWLQGEAPMHIAPECFRLAWRKNITAQQALHDRRWMRGLRRISTTSALHQFVDLWGKLQHIQLSEVEDTISWRLTANGSYSAASAYEVQFLGSLEDHRWAQLWQLKVEKVSVLLMAAPSVQASYGKQDHPTRRHGRRSLQIMPL